MALMDDEEYKGYPTYHAFNQDEGYPLLMFNTHYPRSACTDFNNVAVQVEKWTGATPAPDYETRLTLDIKE